VKNETTHIPCADFPMMRIVLRILESHEKDGVTIIDKAEVEEIYVITENSEFIEKGEDENV